MQLCHRLSLFRNQNGWSTPSLLPFGGPEAVLAYLSRYTHRVAISNARLVSADAHTVAFRWKDYRVKSGGPAKVMRLATPEFIRRFLIHVLPDGFHRIRHYGLLASSTHKANIRMIRALLCVQRPEQVTAPGPPYRDHPTHPARTMSLLRRTHAHHRDLPARPETDVARPTEGAGSMTYRPSSVTRQHRLHPLNRSEQRVLAYFQRDSRRQYLQNAQHRRDHQPGLRPYPALPRHS